MTTPHARDMDLADTTATRLITHHVTQIINDKAVGAIVGPPGVGKTYTVRRLQIEECRICYVQASALTEKLGPLLRLIRESVTGTDYIRYDERSTDKMFNGLSSLFRWSKFCLVIDEAQNLSAGNLRTLQSWNDDADTQLPIVCISNRQWLRGKKVNTPAIQQITSRGFADRTLVLEPAPWRDVETISFSFDVSGKAAFAHLRERWETGALDLRRLADQLKTAKLLAKGGAVELRHLQDALIKLNPSYTVQGSFKINHKSDAA